MSSQDSKMDLSEIQIRFANTDDIELFMRARDEEHSDAYTEFIRRLTRFEVVLAFLCNEPVGLISYTYKEFSDQNLVPTIDDIFVIADFKLTDIGERMFGFLEQHLRQAGHTVVLGIARNEPRLEEWFIRLGFSLTLRVDTLPDDTDPTDLETIVEIMNAGVGIARFVRYLR